MRSHPCLLQPSSFHSNSLGLVVSVLLGLVLLGASCVDAPDIDFAGLNALDVCAVANDGDLCDDHQACTFPDTCMNKKCVGTPVADGTRCTDGNVCTINDHCVAAVCVGTVAADGTACTDGDPCTDPDICQQGICQPGGPLICDDGDACTIDSCQSGVGCVFSPRDCVVPPDAAPEVTVDATPPPDVAEDAPPSDTGDDGTLDLDGSGPRIDTGVDTGAPDGGAPDADAGSDADASDAAADAQSDTRDAALDLMETPPDLRARGGGCACTLGDRNGAPGAPLSVIGAAFVAVLLLRRRRSSSRSAASNRSSSLRF